MMGIRDKIHQVIFESSLGPGEAWKVEAEIREELAELLKLKELAESRDGLRLAVVDDKAELPQPRSPDANPYMDMVEAGFAKVVTK